MSYKLFSEPSLGDVVPLSLALVDDVVSRAVDVSAYLREGVPDLPVGAVVIVVRGVVEQVTVLR